MLFHRWKASIQITGQILNWLVDGWFHLNLLMYTYHIWFPYLKGYSKRGVLKLLFFPTHGPTFRSIASFSWPQQSSMAPRGFHHHPPTTAPIGWRMAHGKQLKRVITLLRLVFSEVPTTKNMGVSKNREVNIMDKPYFLMDDLEVPLFLETSIWRKWWVFFRES